MPVPGVALPVPAFLSAHLRPRVLALHRTLGLIDNAVCSHCVYMCVCGVEGGQNMTYLFCMEGGGSSFSSPSFPEHTSGPLHACPDFYSDKWSHFWKSVTSVVRKSGGEVGPLSWSLLVCVYKEAQLWLSQQADAYFRSDDELLYLMWGRSTEEISFPWQQERKHEMLLFVVQSAHTNFFDSCVSFMAFLGCKLKMRVENWPSLQCWAPGPERFY